MVRPLVLGAALAISLASPSVFAAASAAASTSSTRELPRQPSAADIAAGIDRLAVVGSVLYVAAHPDDENTRLLAWLVGERGLRAGYLSLTRGDGGQNLIGTEQGELLGLIRTQELLAARRVDGAEQLFTRARDFGYSKSADETLRVWGRDDVLADVVRAVRRFQPDVVITRFNTSPPNHGHHTASAVLAAEAFVAAADEERFPDQLGSARPWQATRLLYNVSTWRMPEGADMSRFLKLDVGGYDPLTGRSWGEVAAASRSQHKSQGFGAAAVRGEVLEYFEHVAGSRAQSSPFDGLDFSWGRFPGTAAISSAIDDARQSFDVRAPHASVPALRRVHAALAKLPDDNPWKARKQQEVVDLIVACAGLYLDVSADEAAVVQGGALPLRATALNRSPAAVRLVAVTLPGGKRVAVKRALVSPRAVEVARPVTVPRDAPVSTPYWLERAATGGLYTVDDPTLIGAPEGPAPLSATFHVVIDGFPIAVHRPVVKRWVDPVRGELTRVVEVAPAVTLSLERDVVMMPNGAPQAITVDVLAGRANAKGVVRLELPAGFRASPKQASFRIAERGGRQRLTFQVTSAQGGATAPATMRAVAVVDGRRSSWMARTVEHDHIPPQVVRRPAEARLVPVSLVVEGERVGYIPGPGDLVAESLAAVGYDVTVLTDERLARADLSSFDAIVVGVRAFNANPRLAAERDRLLKYVEGGGRLVVQYNTNSHVGPLTVDIGPYPLEIGRDRVTDETAPMTPVHKDEPLLAGPNALGPEDFEGWVQERGLYFAKTWDPRYRAVFRMHDDGEPPLEGALLLARHGKGTFVYTGISFFRQLPAGVPGAYRLMANLLAQ